LCWPSALCIFFLLLCPDLHMSVCRMPRPNSRTERPRKPKIGRWKPITRVTRVPIYRSKVKVTRPINAVTDIVPYAGRENYNFLKISLLLLLASSLYTDSRRTFVAYCDCLTAVGRVLRRSHVLDDLPSKRRETNGFRHQSKTTSQC